MSNFSEKAFQACSAHGDGDLDDKTRAKICEKTSRLLRERREGLGLSINEVTRRTGLAQQTVAFVERGMRMPTLDTFLRIPAALDLDLWEVLREASS
jgi:DNA-binding XRE family transcriptional regulator